MEFIHKKTDLTRALGGYIYKNTTGIVAVLIWQNMLFISSEIAKKDLDIKVELPNHEGFYLDIKTEFTNRRIKIDKNKNLDFKLFKDESFNVILPYTGGV